VRVRLELLVERSMMRFDLVDRSTDLASLELDAKRVAKPEPLHA
jgi:hypothetical protein